MVVDSSQAVITIIHVVKWPDEFAIVGSSSLRVTQAKSPEHLVPGSLLSHKDVRVRQEDTAGLNKMLQVRCGTFEKILTTILNESEDFREKS